MNLILFRLDKKFYTRILTVIVICLAMQMFAMVYAQIEGGYISSREVGQAGVGNSIFVVGSGISNQQDMVVMGPRIATLTGQRVAGAGSATLRGNIASLNGFSSVTAWFEWGLVGEGVSNVTPVQTITTTGEVTADIPITSGQEINYRFAAELDGTARGAIMTLETVESTMSRLVALIPIVFISLLVILGIAAIALGLTIPGLIMVAIGFVLGIAFLDTLLGMIARLW